MPLKPGKSKKTFNQNVSEIMHAYSATKSIGNSNPKSKAKAVKQAVAIAYSKQQPKRKVNVKARLKALK